MIVTAWNNGKNNPSGSGYGFKVDIKDRDIYFNKDWKKCLFGIGRRRG
jgi:hypothetical protein